MRISRGLLTTGDFLPRFEKYTSCSRCVFLKRKSGSILSIIFNLCKCRKELVVFPLLLFFLYSQSVTADTFKLTAGAEYITGDFGGDTPVDEWYVPLTGKYITDRYVFRLTVPYISLTAPVGTKVSGGPDGQIIVPGDGKSATEQGLGDVIASVTIMDVLNSEASAGISLDLTGKIKFGTADESKGLGTGENDYTVQADLFKYFDRVTAYGIAGYTFRDSPPGIYLEDVWFALVGGVYHFTPELGAGLDLYFREASSVDFVEQKELTALVDFKINEENKVRAYVLRGLSDGSPDWGVGVMFSVDY